MAHGKSVADQLHTSRTLQIEKNRHYLKVVADVILLCALHEIALRGHDESLESVNRGFNRNSAFSS